MMPVFTYQKVASPMLPALRQEIENLWRQEQAGIENVEERLSQIRWVGRDEDGTLAGVCSSQVEKGVFNSQYFHAMRVLVGKPYRQNLLAFELLAHMVEDLHVQRQGKGQIGPVGVKAIIQSSIVAERGAIHCTRTFQFPVNKIPYTFLLSGFTSRKHPEYCCYFPDDGDSAKAVLARWAADSEAFSKEASIVALGDTSPESDWHAALALTAGGTESGGVSRELQTPHYRKLYTLTHNGQLQAVCELVPREVPEINARLLGLHLHAAPEAAEVDLLACLAREVFEQLNQPGQPSAADAAGLFLVYTSRTGLPIVCPVTGFHLHGVDRQGQELRVRFFEEIKVKVPL
ncbi:MAG: hypothetical protein AAGI11_14180 [Pseudomonadota bacterium]